MGGGRWRACLAILLSVALLAACSASSGDGDGSGSGPDPRKGDALAFGLAPRPDNGATFRSDVVLVDGGPGSVRSVTADGLTWTLDASAAGLGDLELGQVMFLTDRAVGRVVAVRNLDADVEVTLAPVDVTDVIEQGSFASDDVAISDPVVVSQRGAFWADPELQGQAGVEEDAGVDIPRPASWRGGSSASLPRPPAPSAVVAETAKATTGAFEVNGACCSKGPSATLRYNKNGLVMSGRIGLEMDRPTASFKLDISGATVRQAGLTVRGAVGLNASLTAATADGKKTNGYSPPLGTDFAFSVPVGTFYGVPLSMVVTQHFTVAVNIPGSAKLDASGRVKLSSTIGFGYSGGRFKNTSTASLDTSGSLADTNSIAVGLSSASFDYNLRFTVGFGIANFVAGVYLAFGVHVVAAVGPPLGFNPRPDAEDPIEHCKSVQADLWLDYGVGYSIPEVVVTVINFFLKAFHSTPMKKSGGLSPGGWQPILSKYAAFPNSGFCVDK